MKRKAELLTNFKWILKMSIPKVEMLQKEIQSLCNFSFLKIVKIEPINKVQSFFSKRDAFSARKTSLVISYFLEKYVKKFFVLPTLPSNEKNSFDHHNSYNKAPNLACNSL
jgi:hypothetical protein